MKRTKYKQKVIGYLRVSSLEQDTEKNEAAILKFANDRDFGKVVFVSEKISGAKSWKKRKLFDVVENLNAGDILIVPELSRLGRSIIDVLDVLNILTNKEVKVFSVKEASQLNGTDLNSKITRTMFALFAEIERDLISVRTKEGLQAAKAKGQILGRPKGIGKSRLDVHKEPIIALLKNGSQRQFIASRYGVTSAALLHWLKRHGLNETEAMP